MLHTQGEAEAMLDALDVLGCIPKRYEFKYDTRTSSPTGQANLPTSELATLVLAGRAGSPHAEVPRADLSNALRRNASIDARREASKSMIAFFSIIACWVGKRSRASTQPTQTKRGMLRDMSAVSDAPAKVAVQASKSTEDVLELG